MCCWDDQLLVIQDDSRFAVIVDVRGRPSAVVPFPSWPRGEELDEAERKRTKLDLEGCFTFDGPSGPTWVAVPSGATVARRTVVVGTSGASAREVEMDWLFDALLGLPELNGVELNIEGGCVVGERLWLVQRGNGLGRWSALLSVPFPEFVEALHSGLAPSRAEARVEHVVELGLLDGVHLTPTDIQPTPEGFLLCAAAEQSANAYDDGIVVGSALAVFDARGLRWAPLVDAEGARLPVKAEGVVLDPSRVGTAFVVTDPDDPHVPAELLEVELSGPWFSEAPPSDPS